MKLQCMKLWHIILLIIVLSYGMSCNDALHESIRMIRGSLVMGPIGDLKL